MEIRKSNFSQTCNLLSKYVKENRNFTDHMSRVLEKEPMPSPPPSVETSRRFIDTETIHQESGLHAAAPLTIIYDGKVLVYDDFPADKVSELMALATGETWMSDQKIDESENSGNRFVNTQHQVLSRGSNPALDMPIARRNSLLRFLAKRKARNHARSHGTEDGVTKLHGDFWKSHEDNEDDMDGSNGFDTSPELELRL